MTECLFCKIAAKEIPAKIIREDSRTVVFLDASPISPGHTLIIPKNHVSAIVDLSDEDLTAVFRMASEITARLTKAFDPAGFTIGINQGRISGQSIDHFHLHIIPRFEGDRGGSIHSVVHNPPGISLDEILDKIIKA
jgi:histidine triad (HIT) family protein